jgi:hypothetical protein
LGATPTVPFVVGDYVAVSGHTGNAANLVMNQTFRVTSVTSATVYVLAGTGMTAATYNAGTIIAKHLPYKNCLLPTNYRTFTAADNSEYVMGPEVVINYAADFDGADLDDYVLGDAQGGMKFGLGTSIVDFNTDGNNLPTFVSADLTNVDFGTSKLADSATAGTTDLVNLHRAILNGTDFGEVDMEQGQLIGLRLTANSNTTMPATSNTVGDFNMSIIGTVDGQKKLLTNKKL